MTATSYLLITAGANLHVTAHALHHHAVAHPQHHAVDRKGKAKKAPYIHLPVVSHIRVRGPALDYVGLFLFTALTGLGVNGFGEAALIAAGVYVARHHIPVAPVVLIAAAGSCVGGVVGFIIGKRGGRALLTTSGPLARFRRRMLKHSEEVYLHYDVLAILIMPAWTAGIHRIRWLKFLWLNLASSLIWAGVLGLGAYYLGSRVTTEFSSELGWILGGVAVVLVIYYFIHRALRAPSRHSRAE